MISYLPPSFFFGAWRLALGLALAWTVTGPALAGTPQTITFPAVGNQLTNAAPFSLGATASSGLTVSYSVVSTPGGIAAVDGAGVVTLGGAAGSVTIRATQPGDATYDAAPEVLRTFAVGLAAQRLVKVANGGSHAAGIAGDGTLWTWGGDWQGQLGTGTWTARPMPGQVGTATDWTAVACGAEHTVAVRADGTLWSWGGSGYGQLGREPWATPEEAPEMPAQVGTETTWSKVACGDHHTVAVRSDGTLWAWGKNENGQLGDGTTIQRTAPVQVGSATTWDKVVCGPGHTLARRSDGTLWAWGKNDQGQLGDGSLTDRSSPVQVGTGTDWVTMASGAAHSLGIRSDGTLWAWGQWPFQQETAPVQIGSGTTWTAVAVAGSASVALQADGTLWTWGWNQYGLLGAPGEDLRLAPGQMGSETTWAAISGGGNTAMALRADGTPWAWGFNDGGQAGGRDRVPPAQPAVAGRFTHVAGYDDHCMARREDGTLWGWGGALSGQLGIPPTGTVQMTPVQAGSDTDWADVYCGRYYTMAHRTDGTLWAWGDNQCGQLGDGTTTQRTSPVQIGTAGMYPVVACGYLYTLAIRADGTLWAWGDNAQGQLGDGTTIQRTSPVLISTAQWKAVACAFNHSVGIQADGTLWAWGNNSWYQLGNGTQTASLVPVQVGSATDWTAAGTGYNYTLAVRGGTLWGWGSNHQGVLDSTPGSFYVTTPVQLGTATNWVAADGSLSHAVARRADGTLWSWAGTALGRVRSPLEPTNAPGQVGTGTNWVQAVSADTGSICLRSDGTLWSWGGSSGQEPDDIVPAPRSIWPAASPQALTLNALPALEQGQPVVMTAGSSSGLPVTLTVAGPATLSGNVLTPTGPGAITVAVYQDGDAAWHPAEPVMQTVLLAAPPTAQESWRQTHFGTTANSGSAADTFDADDDGLANLVEYAFGLTPTSGSSGAAQLPQPVKTGGSFTVSFTEPAGVSGVTYGARCSADLAGDSWTPLPDTGSGTTHIFTVPLGAGDTRMFVRLEVTAAATP